MKTTTCTIISLIISLVGLLPAAADENQLNLEVVVNYTIAINTGQFQDVLKYANFLNFNAKLYGDKNVFPWMGEYTSLTDYANVVKGYEGIINETTFTIDWTFSNDGKVMGSGIQSGTCANGNSFAVGYSSVMTLSAGLIIMREDWYDTAKFYEQCYCDGMGNYMSCINAGKRALETEEERQARSTSGSMTVAADPSTYLATFMTQLSNSSAVISDDFSFTLLSVFNFPLSAFTSGKEKITNRDPEIFGLWEITKNQYVASIAYYDSYVSYSSPMSIFTAKANFTSVTGVSVIVPLIAYGEFNDALKLKSVSISMDTYELGKALCVTFDCNAATPEVPQAMPEPVAEPVREPLGAIPRPPPSYVRPPNASSRMSSAISLILLFCIMTLVFF